MHSGIFDESASEFSRSLDRMIEDGRYVRGAVFLDAVRRWVPPGGAILDFGCGPGRLASLIASAGYRVVGLDPASQMIAQARRLPAVDGLRFDVLSDGQSQERHSFDAIVCSSVIEYVPEPVELLGSFREWLRPGGRLILTYANRLSVWGAYAFLRNPRARHRSVQHNLWTFRSARQALTEAGFVVEGPPLFFESPLDKYAGWSWLKGSRWVGTLGLVVATPQNR